MSDIIMPYIYASLNFRLRVLAQRSGAGAEHLVPFQSHWSVYVRAGVDRLSIALSGRVSLALKTSFGLQVLLLLPQNSGHCVQTGLR